MKKMLMSVAVFMMLVMLCACGGSDDDGNGLPDDVNAIIPNSIIEEVERLDMRINRGDNPPNVERTFFISPLVLISSNISADTIGKKYNDVKIKFYNQDNVNGRIDVLENEDGTVEGVGTGAYVVGEGNKFTVIVELTKDYGYYETRVAYFYSGTMSEDGVEDLKMALVMLDDGGDPEDKFIEEGEARIFYDEDGFSEELLSNQNIKKSNSNLKEASEK